MKSNISKIMIMVLILMNIIAVPVSFADLVSVLEISDEWSSTSNIGIDTTFTLRFKLTNNGPALNNVRVELVDMNSFQMASGNNYRDYTTIGSGSVVTVPFNLKRTGGDNTVTVKVYEKGNESDYFINTITVPNASIIDDGGSSGSTDTTKNAPNLLIDPDMEIPDFKAGETVELKIPIKNIGKHSAKNVIVTLNMGDDSPFVIEKAGYKEEVGRVLANKTEYAIFDLKVSETAKNQIHKLSLDINYENNYGDKYESKDNALYIKVSNGSVEPILGVTDYRFIGEELNAGEEDAVLLQIENKGDVDVYNVRVELSGFEKDGIRLLNDVDTKSIDKLRGKDNKSVYYNITASPTAKSGTYELKAKMTYTDFEGNEYERTSSVYVPVNGIDSDAVDIKVENISSPSEVKAGDKFTVSFDITNQSGFDVKKLEIGMEYPNSIIPTSSPKTFIKGFENEATEHMTYTFMAKEDATSGFNEMYINLKYTAEGDTEENAGSSKEFVGIMISGKSALGRPKIIVKDYEIVGGDVAPAGEEFDLKVEFYNTSSDEMVKNIKVAMESDDGVFIPVDSSSSFFIESIGRQEIHEEILHFKVKNDANVKVYNLKLTMEYEDGQGNAYDSQEQPYKEVENLSLQVSQPVRLQIDEPMLPFDATVGTPFDIEIAFYNMGKAPLYNLRATASGDFQVMGSTQFYGNFETGKSNWYYTTIVPTVEGDNTGKVLFEFEDAMGNALSEEVALNFYASGGDMGIDGEYPDGEFPDGGLPDGGNPGDGGMEGGQGAASLKTIVMALGLFVAMVLGVVLFKKRHKKAIDLGDGIYE